VLLSNHSFPAGATGSLESGLQPAFFMRFMT
jgi:hypothetical protein